MIQYFICMSGPRGCWRTTVAMAQNLNARALLQSFLSAETESQYWQKHIFFYLVLFLFSRSNKLRLIPALKTKWKAAVGQFKNFGSPILRSDNVSSNYPFSVAQSIIVLPFSIVHFV